MTFHAVVSSSEVAAASACAVYDATVYSVSDGTKARTVAAVVDGPARLRGLEDVPQRALGVVHLRLEVVALAEERSVFSLKPPPITQPSLSSGWPLASASEATASAKVVRRIDVMQGAHDLGRTPSLVDAQVGHNVGSLEAAVAVGHRRCHR